MASCPVASAPRAAADSRRPVFVTTCHRFCHERRVVTRFEGICGWRCSAPTKASDPSALAAAELIGRAKRVPRLAVRRARESCIVSSRLQRCVLCLLPQRVSWLRSSVLQSDEIALEFWKPQFFLFIHICNGPLRCAWYRSELAEGASSNLSAKFDS